MTDLTSEKDRLKFFFPDGCGLLKTPAKIENQYHEKGIRDLGKTLSDISLVRF